MALPPGIDSLELWLQCAAHLLAVDPRVDQLLTAMAGVYSPEVLAAITNAPHWPSRDALIANMLIRDRGELYQPLVATYRDQYLHNYIYKDVLPLNVGRPANFLAALQAYDAAAPPGEGGMNKNLYELVVTFVEYYLRSIAFRIGMTKMIALFPQLDQVALAAEITAIQTMEGEDEEFGSMSDDEMIYWGIVGDIARQLVTPTTKFADLATVLRLDPAGLQMWFQRYYDQGRDEAEEENAEGVFHVQALGKAELIVLTSPYAPVWVLPPISDYDLPDVWKHLNTRALPPRPGPGDDPATVEVLTTLQHNVREGKIPVLVFRSLPVVIPASFLEGLWNDIIRAVVTVDKLATMQAWLLQIGIDVMACLRDTKSALFPPGAGGAIAGIGALIAQHI